MKKIISSLLIGCLLVTLIGSTAQQGFTASVPMNTQNLQTVVGGIECWEELDLTAECAAEITFTWVIIGSTCQIAASAGGAVIGYGLFDMLGAFLGGAFGWMAGYFLC